MSAVRILAATLVLAGGVGVSVWLFSTELGVRSTDVCQSRDIPYCDVKTDWQNAVGATLAILSVGVAAAILATGRQRGARLY